MGESFSDHWVLILLFGPVVFFLLCKLSAHLSFLFASLTAASFVVPWSKETFSKDIGITIVALTMAAAGFGLWFLCRTLGHMAASSETRAKAIVCLGLGTLLVGAGPFYVGMQFYRTFKLHLVSDATYFGLPFLGLLLSVTLAACAMLGYQRARV